MKFKDFEIWGHFFPPKKKLPVQLMYVFNPLRQAINGQVLLDIEKVHSKG